MAGRNASSFPVLGSPQRVSTSSSAGRNKVQLKPGHSLMDWIRLGKTGKDLTGVGGKIRDVTPEELKKHNKDGDVWITLRGKVYNVSAYLDFHPGGVDELMRGAGKDATSLFDEIHKYVNAESMLEKCYIGKLKVENEMLRNTLLRRSSQANDSLPNGETAGKFLLPSAPLTQTPRFDWYQNMDTVSVIVYTQWTSMAKEHLIVDRTGKELLITVHIKQTVYYVHIDLEKDVENDFQANISNDSGKVEMVLQKSQSGIEWSSVGKYLDKHNQCIALQQYTPAYRECKIDKAENVTTDTKLYTILLPHGCTMCIPTGYHVHIKHNIEGMEVVRSYTAVVPSLDSKTHKSDVQEGHVIYLMIKTYVGGALTPWLNSLKPGDALSISSYMGNFDISRLNECTHLVMLAAGTGFTPMVRLIYITVVQQRDKNRSVKLMFFNKTQSDIIWRDQLNTLTQLNDRFIFTNCLSEADDSWTGLRGRVTKDIVKSVLPDVSGTEKLLICVCGPLPFTQTVIKFTEELGYKDMTHAFLG